MTPTESSGIPSSHDPLASATGSASPTREANHLSNSHSDTGSGDDSIPASAADAGSTAKRSAGRVAQLNRGQILDATEVCLVECGIDDTTIREIARRLKCAVGSIYRYFVDKQELLDGVVHRRFRPVLEAVDDAGAGNTDLAALQKSVDAYLSIAAHSPQQYRLMYWHAITGESDAMTFDKARVKKATRKGTKAVPRSQREADPDAAPVAANGLPGTIGQVLAAWKRCLGDDDAAAQRLWSDVHGRAILGRVSALPPVDVAAFAGNVATGKPVVIAKTPQRPAAVDSMKAGRTSG